LSFILNEGLVVSTCLGGAFVGSLVSGWIADGVGRRRAFQLCALPMIIGASMRYADVIKKLIAQIFILAPECYLELCVAILVCLVYYIFSFI
jgi:MFS family permease